MENASKALLMAAEILVGVLVLSIGVYLYITFSSASSRIKKENEQSEINQYNSQYTSYEGKENLTIYDVVTIANLAKDNNEYYGYTKEADKSNFNNYICVTLQNRHLEWYNDDQLKRIIIR